MASRRAQLAVATHLHLTGNRVQITPVKVAPTPEEIPFYVDDGDIFVLKRIEAKGRGIPFTCAKDFPFRTVFVANVASVKRAGGEVEAYYSLSEDLRTLPLRAVSASQPLGSPQVPARHGARTRIRQGAAGRVEFPAPSVLASADRKRRPLAPVCRTTTTTIQLS